MSLANVTGGNFGEIFDAQLNGQVYAQPLVSGNTVLAVTENDNAYGLQLHDGRDRVAEQLRICPTIRFIISVVATWGTLSASGNPGH